MGQAEATYAISAVLHAIPKLTRDTLNGWLARDLIPVSKSDKRRAREFTFSDVVQIALLSEFTGAGVAGTPASQMVKIFREKVFDVPEFAMTSERRLLDCYNKSITGTPVWLFVVRKKCGDGYIMDMMVRPFDHSIEVICGQKIEDINIFYCFNFTEIINCIVSVLGRDFV